MKKEKNDKFSCETAGYSGRLLYFKAGPCECGRITNGVSFEHNNEGCWVIDYKDLSEMFKLAQITRQEKTIDDLKRQIDKLLAENRDLRKAMK